MSLDLFRKEAMGRRSRSLLGEVVIKGSVSSWILTALLTGALLLLAGTLFFGEIETESGAQKLWKWLWSLSG